MAIDQKISELDPLDAVALDDLLAIIDVSDPEKTKGVTIEVVTELTVQVAGIKLSGGKKRSLTWRGLPIYPLSRVTRLLFLVYSTPVTSILPMMVRT